MFYMQKALVSVTGVNRAGIIAKVSTALYLLNVSILDISQTILSGYFTMLMVVDIGQSEKNFTEITADLDKVAKEMDIAIVLQRMDMFESMHRI